MKHKENSGNERLNKPKFQDQSITQIDVAVKSLKSIRKAFIGIKILLASPDPYVDDIMKKMAVLDAMPDTGPIALLIPLIIQEIDVYRSKLEEIKNKRSDVRNRREEFVRMARDSGYNVHSMGAADYVGPFKVKHIDKDSSIWFGKYKLKKIAYPSGGNVLNTLRDVSLKLENDALRGWSEFIEQIVAAQEGISKTEPVPWKKLLNAAVPEIAQQRKFGSLLCYRLSMLISGKAPGGWQAITVPPTLAEQRDAWSVPVIDKPNDIRRVNRLQLRKMTAQVSGSAGPAISPGN